MKNVVWIVGSPRSGTSFLTDFIGQYTDFCFNEPWDDYPLGDHQDWDLPDGKSVFKYCANALYYQEISRLYPGSKWVHIVRDPLHVLYSMFYPKEESWPERSWKKMGDKPNERIINMYGKWSLIRNASMDISEAHLVKYEDLDVEGLAEFLDLPLSRDDLDYTNRNDVCDPEKMQNLVELLKCNWLSTEFSRVPKIHL